VATTKTKGTHGGKRKGSGRKLGSGNGPGPNARTQRVSTMFSKAEEKMLIDAARKELHPNTVRAGKGETMPVSTLVHRLTMAAFAKAGAKKKKAPAKKAKKAPAKKKAASKK